MKDTPCLVLVKPRKRWKYETWTDRDEAGDYVVPNVLSPTLITPERLGLLDSNFNTYIF